MPNGGEGLRRTSLALRRIMNSEFIPPRSEGLSELISKKGGKAGKAGRKTGVFIDAPEIAAQPQSLPVVLFAKAPSLAFPRKPGTCRRDVTYQQEATGLEFPILWV